MNPRLLKRAVDPRSLLIAGNVCACLLLAFVGYAVLSSSRDSFAQRARDASENLAAVLVNRIEAEVDQIDNALRSAAFGLRRLGTGASPTAIEQVLAEQQLLVEDIEAVRIVDASGLVRHGARIGTSPTINVSERDWFRQIRDGARSGLVISEPLQSRIDKKWVVVFARRLEEADGRFAGAVYATVDVAAFGRMLQGVSLGEEGAATLRSASLALIARRTSREESTAAVGSTKVSAELSRALLERPNGGFFVSRTSIDGVERSNAYRRGLRYPLLVLVGLGTQEFFALWRTQAIETVGILATIALVLGLASTLLWRAWLRQASAQEGLSQLAAEQQAMLDNEIVGMTKARGRVTIWKNRALDRIFGYEANELLGTPTRQLYLDDRSHEALGAHAYEVLAKGGTYRSQLQMRRKDGTAIWVDISGTRINDDDSLWLMVDISAMKQHEARVEHIAFHDALTGLPNRLRLTDRLSQALEAARAAGGEVVLAYLDLDGFKSVNDTHGHEAGDTLLREVASRLTAEVRGKDTIARLGGDEFVIVMVDTQARPGAENVLERILKRLQEPVEVLPGTYAAIGASVGVAVYPDDAQDGKALLARADEAMFAAKRAGKQRIRFFRDAALAAVEAEAYAVDAARFAAAGMPDTRHKH